MPHKHGGWGDEILHYIWQWFSGRGIQDFMCYAADKRFEEYVPQSSPAAPDGYTRGPGFGKIAVAYPLT
jgi:hypothetical protein